MRQPSVSGVTVLSTKPLTLWLRSPGAAPTGRAPVPATATPTDPLAIAGKQRAAQFPAITAGAAGAASVGWFERTTATPSTVKNYAAGAVDDSDTNNGLSGGAVLLGAS